MLSNGATPEIYPALQICQTLRIVQLRNRRSPFGPKRTFEALTLFYVGGASSTFKLLSCQRVDGERVSLPNEPPGPKDMTPRLD